MAPSSAKNKGAVGKVYEFAFGIEPNSRPEADFPGAGIELKSVPIRIVTGEARAKERVSLTMINFLTLPSEQWDTAPVRKKLNDLLLIFYRWDPLQPIARFETLAAEIWQPDAESLRQMQVDWESVRDLVRIGRRDEVSEGSTRLLGAATKGLGHGSTSRAWSLKQTFVGYIYRSISSDLPITTAPSLDPGATFEREVLARVEPHVGRSLADLAEVVGRAGKTGKAASAQAVRALVGERGKGRSGDFERFGIETKIVPVNAAGHLVEAMSFPTFVHEELVFETWEASDLLARIQRMLIVPIHRERRASLAEARLGRPFFWSPRQEEFRGIDPGMGAISQADRTRSGARPTEGIPDGVHPRSAEGRDAADRDQAPGGFDVDQEVLLAEPAVPRTRFSLSTER